MDTSIYTILQYTEFREGGEVAILEGDCHDNVLLTMAIVIPIVVLLEVSRKKRGIDPWGCRLFDLSLLKLG